MPIHRLMQKAVFDTKATSSMAAAYEAALAKAGLSDRADPLTELLADKIIELYRSGVRDSENLCSQTLAELGITTGK